MRIQDVLRAAREALHRNKIFAADDVKVHAPDGAMNQKAAAANAGLLNNFPMGANNTAPVANSFARRVCRLIAFWLS